MPSTLRLGMVSSRASRRTLASRSYHSRMRGDHMRRVVSSLLIVARVLGILAVLALLYTSYVVFLLVNFTCFDICPTRERYFPRQLSTAISVLGPCIVLAALALVVFLVYCLATRQIWRAVITLLFFLVVTLIGIAVLNALVDYGRATVPVWPESDILTEHQVMDWANQWALTVLLFGVVWAGGLACLEWGHSWRRQSQPASSQPTTA